MVFGIILGLVVGGGVGFWLGRRGKQEVRNVLDSVKSKIPLK